MKLIWTRSSLPLSRFIRWGLNEPVSHFAILFDDKLVFQSNLLGVHPEGIYAFEKGGAEIVDHLDLGLTLEQEEAFYQELMKHYEGAQYDYKAFAYFTYRAFLYKFFGKPIPPVDAWGSPNAYLCTGLSKVLTIPESPEWLRNTILSVPDSEFCSPYKLYQMILDAYLRNPAQKG